MTRALIVVDVQNDFSHPDGSLYCAGGEEIIPVINKLQKNYGRVVYTQDWHPEQTSHFDQWPDHCVAGQWGSNLHDGLDVRPTGNLVRKGTGANEDGYSAFSVATLDASGEQKGVTTTLLHYVLTEGGVTDVDVVGIALDVCVKATALDAVNLGYRTTIFTDATVPVTPEGGADAVAEMIEWGVKVV